jgi:hypothetical protein
MAQGDTVAAKYLVRMSVLLLLLWVVALAITVARLRNERFSACGPDEIFPDGRGMTGEIRRP